MSRSCCEKIIGEGERRRVLMKKPLQHIQAFCLGKGMVLTKPMAEISAEKPAESGIAEEQLGMPAFNVIVRLGKKEA